MIANQRGENDGVKVTNLWGIDYSRTFTLGESSRMQGAMVDEGG